MADRLNYIRSAIIEGKHKEIENLVKAAIEEKVNLKEMINEAMIAGMDVVGQKFADGEIFVPEMLVSAVTMKKGLALIKPLLKDEETESKGTVIMCTVNGDIHDVGKNLVIMMLEGAGFNVIDLGVDLAVELLIQKVKKIKPDILGLSALLTTTMQEMKIVIKALETNGFRNSLKVMVGGAAVDATFAKQIDADGYGKDAAEAVELAKRFIAAK